MLLVFGSSPNCAIPNCAIYSTATHSHNKANSVDWLLGVGKSLASWTKKNASRSRSLKVIKHYTDE